MNSYARQARVALGLGIGLGLGLVLALQLVIAFRRCGAKTEETHLVLLSCDGAWPVCGLC